MKFYVIIWDFNIGGVQKHATALANFLVQKNNRVVILYGTKEGSLLESLDSRVELRQLSIRNTNNPFAFLKIYRRLKKEIDQNSVVLANGPNNFRQISRVNFLIGNWKLLYILHNDIGIKSSRLRWFKVFEMKTLLNAKRTKVIALSERQRKRHIETLEVREIEVVPNFIDFNHNHLRKANREHPRGISIGRYSIEKGYDVLLEAVGATSSNVCIDVFGFGEDGRQKLISDASIQGTGRLNFFDARLNILELLSQYDYYVCPSRRESFGISIIEALSCGLPVVTTDCDGPVEVIDHSNGIIVARENSKALADGIEEMHEAIREGKYQPEELRENVAQYSIERVMNKYVDLLKLD